jgi:hypothetical protein
LIRRASVNIPNTNGESRILNPVKFSKNGSVDDDVELKKVHLIIHKANKGNRFFGLHLVQLSFGSEINLVKSKTVQAYSLFIVGAVMLGTGLSLFLK